MIKSLTSLRFFFALFVFLFHIGWVNQFKFSEGFIGVSFFYILSGFILAYNYQNKFLSKEITKADFWRARFARIYPLHLITTVLIIPLVLQNANSIIKWIKVFLSHISLTHSFIPNNTYFNGLNPVSWSISNEAFFYLCFPYVVFLIRYRRKLFAVFFLLAIGIILIFSFGILPELFSVWLVYINPLFRIIDFIIGILLFGMYKKFKIHITPVIAQYLEISSILLLILFIYFRDHIPVLFRFSSYYWVPMSFIILSFAFAKGGLSKLLSYNLFIFLGKISFAFYLIHFLVIRLLYLPKLPIADTHSFMGMLIAFLLSLSLACLLHLYVELPLNRRLRPALGNK